MLQFYLRGWVERREGGEEGVWLPSLCVVLTLAFMIFSSTVISVVYPTLMKTSPRVVLDVFANSCCPASSAQHLAMRDCVDNNLF